MLPIIISAEANIILAEVNVSLLSYLTLSTLRGSPLTSKIESHMSIVS